MPKYEIINPTGIFPKMNPSMIVDNASTKAENCILGNGDARPLRAPVQVATTPRAGVKKAMFRLGNSSPETQYWLTWNTDVSVARGPIAGDTSERLYYTGDGKPKMTYFPIATQGGTIYPTGWRELGVPAPSTPLVATINTNGPEEAAQQVLVYVVTFVTDLGEEGPPGPASAAVTVNEGAKVNLTSIPVPSAGATTITAKRIYRSLSSANAADYLFLTELPAGATSFLDTAGSDDLNEPLATLDYAPPPDGLDGLTGMQNGIMAGFMGNDVYFCEAYMPYAWPTKYSMAVDYKVTGMAAFGQSLVVGTTGIPYLFTGVDPGNMSMERVDFNQSCLSRKSMISVGSGAVYASPDGLCYVGIGGARILTDKHYSQSQWQALNPASMQCYFQDGRIIILYDNGTKASLVLNFDDGSLTTSTIWGDCGFVDPLFGELYLMQGSSIVKWDSGNPLTMTWRSKRIDCGDGFQPAAAMVQAETYPVTVRYYRNEALFWERQVTSSQAFRLPAGRSDTINIEVVADNACRRIALATSMNELRLG